MQLLLIFILFIGHIIVGFVVVVSVLFTVLSLHTGSATEITSSRGGEVPVGSRAQEKGQTFA